MVRGLTPDTWAISSTVASKPRRATTFIAARLMRARVNSRCSSANGGWGRRSGSSIAAFRRGASTGNGKTAPTQLTAEEGVLQSWLKQSAAERDRAFVLVVVCCVIVGGAHSAWGKRQGGQRKVLGLGVAIPVHHSRQDQPDDKEGRPQHPQPAQCAFVLGQVRQRARPSVGIPPPTFSQHYRVLRPCLRAGISHF